ncbi:MAG: hypothetical protein AB8G11_18280 [Saprospiraceae bacterium]
MLIKSKFRILMLSIVIVAACQSEERYVYEEIKSDVDHYLLGQMFNDFAQSDTLIIYDTIYFNNMIASLGFYKNKMVEADSVYNRQIIERLAPIEREKIQTKQPDIYLPFEVIKENLNEKNTAKIMIWLTNVPKQFEAAKIQLEKPNLLQTQQTIEKLKTAYNFVSNDLKIHLDTVNQSEKYNTTIENTTLAIKDYLAFLNSKILNGETS